jgi:hypothetical protein
VSRCGDNEGREFESHSRGQRFPEKFRRCAENDTASSLTRACIRAPVPLVVKYFWLFWSHMRARKSGQPLIFGENRACHAEGRGFRPRLSCARRCGGMRSRRPAARSDPGDSTRRVSTRLTCSRYAVSRKRTNIVVARNPASALSNKNVPLQKVSNGLSLQTARQSGPPRRQPLRRHNSTSLRGPKPAHASCWPGRVPSGSKSPENAQISQP